MSDLHCDACNQLIDDGVKYISICIHREIKKGTDIKVLGAHLEKAYHLHCYGKLKSLGLIFHKV